jgi:hypothetical protein
MRYRALVFIAIGLAGIGVGLLQPESETPQAQRASIQATMERRGYAAAGQADIGKVISIMKFSSGACDNVRVLPVSVLFQESALLGKFDSASDDHTIVYMDEAWRNSPSNPAVLSHLSQRFLQMIRLRPYPAIDTMLYIVSPKTCGNAPLDWSEFWNRKSLT